MGISSPWALDAIDAAAKALVDHRGHYANAKHPDGLKGSAFLWAVADEHGTDQRYIDEREDMREEVVIVALALAAVVTQGIGTTKERGEASELRGDHLKQRIAETAAKPEE